MFKLKLPWTLLNCHRSRSNPRHSRNLFEFCVWHKRPGKASENMLYLDLGHCSKEPAFIIMFFIKRYNFLIVMLSQQKYHLMFFYTWVFPEIWGKCLYKYFFMLNIYLLMIGSKEKGSIIGHIISYGKIHFNPAIWNNNKRRKK